MSSPLRTLADAPLTPRGSAPRRWMVLAVAVAASASVVIALRLTTSEHTIAYDTFWYARLAGQIAGQAADEATARSAAFLVSQRGGDAATLVAAAERIDPRYPAIFASRLVYPAAAVPFMPVFGLQALLVVSVLSGVATALLVTAAAGARSAIVGALAGPMAVAMPSGAWFAVMLADGLMLALWAACLVAAGRFLRADTRGWLLVFGAALIALFLTKSANGYVLAAAVVACCAFVVLRNQPDRRRYVALAGTGVVVAAAHLVVSPLFGWAGITESLQDLATRHFELPDRTYPLQIALGRLGSLVAELPAHVVADPLPFVLAVVGLIGLLRISVPAPGLWFVAGLASLALVASHPVGSEVPRLVAPLWLSASVGLAGGAVGVARSLARYLPIGALPG